MKPTEIELLHVDPILPLQRIIRVVLGLDLGHDSHFLPRISPRLGQCLLRSDVCTEVHIDESREHKDDEGSEDDGHSDSWVHDCRVTQGDEGSIEYNTAQSLYDKCLKSVIEEHEPVQDQREETVAVPPRPVPEVLGPRD